MVPMAKRRSISVSWHEASGQFVKWIGFTRGKDGKRRPKSHYLGDNEGNAIARAAALLADWTAIKNAGGDVWPSQTEPLRSTAAAVAANPSVAERDAKPASELRIEQASIDYLAMIRAERDAQQVTPQHYESMRYKIARIVSYLGPAKTVSSIGEREIKAFVLLVAQRPCVRDHSTPERPMSLGYAKRIVSDAKWFLNWLYESNLWDNRPRNFNRLFRFKAVRSVTERATQLEEGRAEPPHFAVDELSKFYAVACDRHRLWMLLSLNCGFAQAELDSLHRFEIKKLDTDSPFIERFRQKTKVYARWSLWPETADLLRRFMALPNDEDIALLTERGKRLKSVCASGAFSGISEAWRKVAKRSGVTKGSYKLLRKTGAWMTTQSGVTRSDDAKAVPEDVRENCA